MFFAIPLGYFVAVFLLISGIMSGLEFLADRPENCTRAVLLMGLVEAAWPVLAAAVVLLLIQINKQLENLRFAADYVPESHAGKKARNQSPIKGLKSHEDDEPAAPHTTASAPVPTHSLAGLATPKPQQPVPQPIPAPQYPAAQQPVPPSSMGGKAPVYPNSPIPGGGRVPQSSMATAQPQAPAAAPTGKRAPVAPTPPKTDQPQGLSFFKVD